MQEIICRYTKGAEVRWVSHLETLRMLERALRRAKIGVAYSQGYNPRPRLAMGPALPAGMTSEVEMVALFLAQRTFPEDLKNRLNEQLPEGFIIQTAWAIPAYGKKQTLGDIDTSEFIARVKGPAGAEELERRAVGLLSCEALPFTRYREKKTQQLDLRPLILHISVGESADNFAEVKMILQTGSSGGVRPQEILEQLGIAGADWEVSCHRQGLYASAKKTTAKPKGPRLRALHGDQARRRHNQH